MSALLIPKLVLAVAGSTLNAIGTEQGLRAQHDVLNSALTRRKAILDGLQSRVIDAIQVGRDAVKNPVAPNAPANAAALSSSSAVTQAPLQRAAIAERFWSRQRSTQQHQQILKDLKNTTLAEHDRAQRAASPLNWQLNAASMRGLPLRTAGSALLGLAS